MSARGSSSGGMNYWVIVIAVIGVIMSIGNGFWSLANPKGDITELKADFAAYKKEVSDTMRWSTASKDFVTGQIAAIKDENATYRRGLEMIISRIEVKTNTID